MLNKIEVKYRMFYFLSKTLKIRAYLKTLKIQANLKLRHPRCVRNNEVKDNQGQNTGDSNHQ